MCLDSHVSQSGSQGCHSDPTPLRVGPPPYSGRAEEVSHATGQHAGHSKGAAQRHRSSAQAVYGSGLLLTGELARATEETTCGILRPVIPIQEEAQEGLMNGPLRRFGVSWKARDALLTPVRGTLSSDGLSSAH
ncbi:hypothetical protein AAFF_G00049670 [Aldrovandia affinis]|uniref:Uncharacterized protein n=1 Tax=Aldrovandia affinis TaxID=143900 RepID=A0AAD7S1Q6_9TELE|nr:hypothetical protein AAFF_G00049670 [Aldrovandia affinis]